MSQLRQLSELPTLGGWKCGTQNKSYMHVVVSHKMGLLNFNDSKRSPNKHGQDHTNFLSLGDECVLIVEEILF